MYLLDGLALFPQADEEPPDLGGGRRPLDDLLQAVRDGLGGEVSPLDQELDGPLDGAVGGGRRRCRCRCRCRCHRIIAALVESFGSSSSLRSS